MSYQKCSTSRCNKVQIRFNLAGLQMSLCRLRSSEMGLVHHDVLPVVLGIDLSLSNLVAVLLALLAAGVACNHCQVQFFVESHAHIHVVGDCPPVVANRQNTTQLLPARNSLNRQYNDYLGQKLETSKFTQQSRCFLWIWSRMAISDLPSGLGRSSIHVSTTPVWTIRFTGSVKDSRSKHSAINICTIKYLT